MSHVFRIVAPAVLATLACLAVVPALAGARLWLTDGRELEGRSIEREGALYLLHLESGETVALPVELVDRIEEDAGTEPDPTLDPTPEEEPLPRTDHLTDEERAMARALRSNLAPLPAPVRLNRQMDAFGNPGARFVRGTADPDWTPTSPWEAKPELEAFDPADWFRSPRSPHWEPESEYTSQSDKTDVRPAGWYLAPQRSGFAPTDGFRSSDER